MKEQLLKKSEEYTFFNGKDPIATQEQIKSQAARDKKEDILCETIYRQFNLARRDYEEAITPLSWYKQYLKYIKDLLTTGSKPIDNPNLKAPEIIAEIKKYSVD